MRVGFIGDTHGNWETLYESIDSLAVAGVEKIVQVGDFGFWDFALPSLNLDIPIYFIDGNHEQFTLLFDSVKVNSPVPQEVRDNLFYIPRGTVINWGGIVFGFIGGAFSIDHIYRKAGVDWFPEQELPTQKNVNMLLNHGAEFIVSHDAPAECVPYMPNRLWGRAKKDSENRKLMQTILEKGNPKAWVHGHYHMHYKIELQKCKIIGLDIAPDVIIYDTDSRSFIK